MAIKHTPGPYTASFDEVTFQHPNGKIYILARIYSGITGNEAQEIKANANLFAAAPELLAAGKLAQYHLERFAKLLPKSYHLDDMKSLNEAIAKAEDINHV